MKTSRLKLTLQVYFSIKQIYTEFPFIKRNWLYRFYSLTTNLNISIEIFKYELLQVKYLFLQSLETAE